MHRRLTLSLAMAAIGVGLLVASSFAGAASASSPQRAGSGEAKRGGTLRLNVSNTDFEFTDPAMAYDAIGWQMLYAVNITLLELPGQAGARGRAAPFRRRRPGSRACRATARRTRSPFAAGSSSATARP